jgi:anti-sigma factor (TIGR02949 family)
MDCGEAQELITALVDGELNAEERIAVEHHLKACGSCRQAFAAESLLKQQTRSAGRRITAPASLRRAVRGKIDAVQPVREQSGGTATRWFNVTGWRPALVLAALLLVIGALLYTQRPSQNIGVAALATHSSILDGKTVLVRTDNPAKMREELARAVGGHFRPVILDFSLMKLYPVAGFVQKLGGRDVLVTVYQGDGPSVTCFTFLGSEADAPADSERFYDAEMRLNFYSFSRNGLNGLLHREGGVICVLTSRMSAADLLALVRGKSAHA